MDKGKARVPNSPPPPGPSVSRTLSVAITATLILG